MRKASIVIMLIALFCLVLTGAAYAGKPGGSTGTITGTVKDISTGAAVSGATVSNGSVSGTTNSSGVYTLSGVATGTNTLSVTKTGYQTTWQVCTVNTGATTTVNWSLTKAYGTQAIPAKNMTWTIFGWNDLGMHCDQDIYKYFCVLPPYNTIHVQLKNRTNTAGVIMSGVTVSYAFAKKTDSTLHTDFWTYAPSFGWNLPANIGLKGNGLSGNMVADSANKSWVAEGIPVTPYDDDGTWDPYGPATITVKDASTGATLQTADVVVPVSTEMTCSNCHGTTNTAADILTKHDSANGTTLLNDANAGHPHLCAECHASNALGAPGKPGVSSLSRAMHHRHDGKITNDTNGCYNCHPGPKTQCMRGIMARAGKGCVDCHGTMNTMWTSVDGGRQPWLNEPKCGTCHDAKHAENANTLYRNSLLTNGPNNTMNNILYCEACHNGTHGEYTTSNSADSVVTQKFQGDNYWIWNCTVCHQNKTQQNMHR